METNTRRSTADWGDGRVWPTTTQRRWSLRWRYLVIAAVAVAVPAWQLAAASNAHRITTAFAFTAGTQTYIVPAGVCRIRIEAIGASGGEGGTAGTPGGGAWATSSFAVLPGETLRVHVGGMGGAAVGLVPGEGGWNGGGGGGLAVDRHDGRPGKAGSGGGGATDVRRGGDRLEHRIIVAGGGSGGAGGAIGGPIGTGGGDGGELTGHDGFAALGSANAATGGIGGTQTAGGAPGRNAPDRSATATAGTLGVGGNGASGGISGGGGGGGGLYGGGGGGSEFEWASGLVGGGHGGGGSGFGPLMTSFRTGVWGSYGPGRARITYDRDTDACER